MRREFLPPAAFIGILGLTLLSGFAYLGYSQLPDTAAEGEPDRVIEMVADDWYFEPDEVVVEEGDHVKIIVESRQSQTGTYDHGFAVPELGIDQYLEAGETHEIEFVADEPGEYSFYCNVYCGTGHHDMSGTLIVEESDGQQDNEDTGHVHDHGREETGFSPDIEEISLHPSEIPESPDYRLYSNGSFEERVEREDGENLEVEVHTTFEEVEAEVVPGTSMEFWTFDGKVPGPMIRVKEGDRIEWNLHNLPENNHPHNIAIHAASGPGGGGTFSDVGPGGTSKLETEMLDPGVYIYHCAFPNVAEHISYGMYGVIVVEPEDGLPEVDHEYYVAQGDFYSSEGGGQEASDLEDEGFLSFSRENMYKEEPSFVTFNGRPDALRGDRALGVYDEEIHPGDSIRVFFGNGGPAIISSYRAMVGEKMDHYGGEFELIEENEETVTVPAGAAKMFEIDVAVPGTYSMYDHSFPRPYKGAWGEWVVQGDIDDHDEFNPVEYDELR